jgi:hypothetical protein
MRELSCYMHVFLYYIFALCQEMNLTINLHTWLKGKQIKTWRVKSAYFARLYFPRFTAYCT